MHQKLALTVLFLLILITNCIGQKDIQTQYLGWYRYANKMILADKWNILLQPEERRFIHPGRHHQFITHLQVSYEPTSRLQITPGFAYSLQSPNDPKSQSRLAIPELRPYIQVQMKQKSNGKLSVNHRYRIESRYFRKTENDHLATGYKQNFRIRYQLQLQYPLFYLKPEHPVMLLASEEIHLNFGKRIIYNTFDQNRVSAGIRYNLNNKVGFEIDYIYWFQQRQNGKSYFSRNIARFTVYHTIDFRKQ